jgi:hypothetical protein
MDFLKYKLTANADFTVYNFTSTGKNGAIEKAIKYTQTLNPGVYNMGFGDIISESKITGEVEIDDIGLSNNGDIEKVLATVAHSVFIFTEHYPDAFVLFGSNDKAKLRLFRMAISRNMTEIMRTFTVFSAIRNKSGQIVNMPFSEKGETIGFFVKRTNSHLSI